MTTPEPQPAPARVVVAYPSFRRTLLVIGTGLFVIGSPCFGGVLHESAWAFGFGAFAAWMLAGAVP